MKKLMLLTACAALFATGCGRQWWNSYGCGQPQDCGFAVSEPCCDSGCGGAGFGGDMVVSPGFTTGYVPAGPAPVLPGPEIVPSPAR